MKPITLKVKKSVSPLKQTTDPEKKFTAQGAGEQGQLQNISVTGKPGTTIFQPATKTPTFGKDGGKKWEFAMRKEASKAGMGFEDYVKQKEEKLGFRGKTVSSPGNVNVEISEPKTEASEGTVSDVYTTLDQRKYGFGGRSQKIAERQERKAGRQDEKRLKKALKNKAISQSDYDDQMLKAKQKRYGQGEIAKQGRAMMENKENAIIQAEQRVQKKTPRLSTYTKNFEVPTKASKGGESIMAPAGTESSSAVIEKGKKAVLGDTGSGSVVSGTKKGLFNPMNFSENVMGDTKSPNGMKWSALKMTKGNSPFKMKGYGSKKC